MLEQSAERGVGGGGEGEGGGGDLESSVRSRPPQSVQSVARGQYAHSAPCPPSSHCPSEM